MWKSLSFLAWFTISTVLCAKPTIPRNIVQEHIKKHANFSVDPCDDFYAHVCPRGVENDFMQSLIEMRNTMVEEYKESHPKQNWNEFSFVKTGNLGYAVEMFILSDRLESLCSHNETLLTLFLQHVSGRSNDHPESFVETSNCKKKIETLKALDGVRSTFEGARALLKSASDASVANLQLRKIDKKLRSLFNKLKLAVSKQLKKTPWVIKNKALNIYSEALQNITFTTFYDFHNTAQNAIKAFDKARKECWKSLKDKFVKEDVTALCEVIAVGEGVKEFKKPSEKIFNQDKQEIIGDTLQQWNSNDYGSVGFSLAHEIMHALVFDDVDKLEDAGNPLIPLWTKDAGCVEEQTRKTCKTFPTLISTDTTCDSKITFEEDAADLAAYRVVWDVYQKAYIRKTVVPNYESLDNKQLFFYGAAVVFCQQNGMDLKEYHKETHSNNYQRVNSLMSQMDQFADAFKCKPTDRMIKNKARHCEFYGSEAKE
ncbi:hypothetical protein CAEBREN_30505 [Caenorhabditis brenneri]|uniref:Peptidase M13 C-terminal domain-containing protein n=1 Tax=Caenorhabditis brenneri TaxID=135651 RepID=G0NAQ9_CAEBE|nr:hypothetical protein CAEBREN_30505 [Caenorhabditis brenneri]